MDALADFTANLRARDRRALARLTTPAAIQSFLDSIPYSADDRYRCPLSVVRDRRAHCFDGAVFAAALLARAGWPPLLVNMYSERDDEHLLAVFKRAGCWGAVAQSNFVGLRYREPVYRSLRELVMSYFEDYFNIEGLRSLRSYTRPLNLAAFDGLGWTVHDEIMDCIAERLDRLQRIPVLTGEMVARLTPLDRRSYRAGMLGTNSAGVYRP